MSYVITKSEAEYIGFESPSRSVFVYVDPDKTRSKRFSSGTCEVEPKSEIPMHSHKREEEIMFVYQGRGKIIIEKEEYQLKKGTMIFMPKGVGHKFINDTDKKLCFSWVFSPPGYEKEIRNKSKR